MRHRGRREAEREPERDREMKESPAGRHAGSTSHQIPAQPREGNAIIIDLFYKRGNTKLMTCLRFTQQVNGGAQGCSVCPEPQFPYSAGTCRDPGPDAGDPSAEDTTAALRKPGVQGKRCGAKR